MRIFLSVLFFFFIVLIGIEKVVIVLIRFLKKHLLRMKKTLAHPLQKIKASFVTTKSFLHAFAKKLRRRRKKPFSLPFRAKIKYFALGILFSCIFVFPPFIVMVFLQDLPTPQQLTLRQIPQTTKIFDRNGTLLSEIYVQQNRTLIRLSDVPKHLQQATLAIEDKNFYKHPGFDLSAIIRAFQQTVLNNNTQGGSTITQQLIKSSMLTPEQSIARKIKELVLAFWTERTYTKNQILEMYFNQVPYGGTAWGVEAASETYFNKPVNELSLAESAFLAGLTAAPSLYSPYGDTPNAWKNRQKEVLSRMVELHYITQKQKEEAEAKPLRFRTQTIAFHAPHFVEYVKRHLINKYGLATVEKGGLHVTTSIDLKTQEMAEKVVQEEVAKSAYLNLSNGAALVTDPRNGDILAMVGSHDFFDPNGGNFNVVTSDQQPGSSIKVVTYATALSKGFTAATPIEDRPISYTLSDGQLYTPVNYDGRFYGRVSLRFALANSLNIPAVKTLDAVGIKEMITTAQKMGIRSFDAPERYGLSITLGGVDVTMLDMARVNGVLANQGKLVELNPLLKVTDVKGTILEEKKDPQAKQILDPAVTFILSDILADNQTRTTAFGFNSVLEIKDHRVSVKTGTTDDKRDNWTNGYTDKHVVIVWVGNNDNAPMSPTLASGITGAAPIWHRIMEDLVKKTPEAKPVQPSTVIQKFCLGRQEYFIAGTENSLNCGFFLSPTQSYPRLPQFQFDGDSGQGNGRERRDNQRNR
jgi:1A family penicillin-binding protein